MKPHKATSLFPVQTHTQDSVKLGERFTRFTVNLGVICFTLHIILGRGDATMICTRSVKDIAAKIRPVLLLGIFHTWDAYHWDEGDVSMICIARLKDITTKICPVL